MKLARGRSHARTHAHPLIFKETHICIIRQAIVIIITDGSGNARPPDGRSGKLRNCEDGIVLKFKVDQERIEIHFMWHVD